ncbi:hypothetical protein [Arthrobacter sp. HLT1-20]
MTPLSGFCADVAGALRTAAPAPRQLGSDLAPGEGISPLKEFIAFNVPEPDLLEEETTTDPGIEPRVTGP